MPFLTMHALRSVPFSNLNRDEYADPKSVLYGDAPRSRWSSQSLSRPLRLYVEERTGEEALRTRRIPQRMAAVLVDQYGWEESMADNASRQVMHAVNFKVDEHGTRALAFVTSDAIESLADLCHKNREAVEVAAPKYPEPKVVKGKPQFAEPKKGAVPGVEGKEIAAVLRRSNGSISLFGRFLAELPESGVDAARQMAHAFTTHAVASDGMDDFFTAADDVQGDQGLQSVGHLGRNVYTSGVFYQYAALDLQQLMDNLGGDVECAQLLVDAFAEGFIRVLPGGKRTTTAPQTIPDLVHMQVRRDGPMSFAPAFESPVTSHGSSGWSAPSREALARYCGRISKLLGDSADNIPFSGHATVHETPLEGLGEAYESYFGADGLAASASKALLREAG